ncbi:MAG TPA: hypothetical protein VFU57_01115 [Candidatus Acidoferrales bacterium]|nr:hypothetical protein [Candidatus Acidoferrales bacterium]
MKRILLYAAAIALCPSAMTGSRAQAREKTSSSSARQSIDALNQKEAAACMSMDHAASAALWADDGVDLIQGLAPMIGKQAISSWYNSLAPLETGAKMEYCTIDWQAIKIQGDWAWEWGINRQKIDFPAPRKPFVGEGKILLILKKQSGGEWKIELESWNSNPPAKAAQ